MAFVDVMADIGIGDIGAGAAMDAASADAMSGLTGLGMAQAGTLGSGLFIDPITQSILDNSTVPLAETVPTAQGLNAAGAFPTEVSYYSPTGQPYMPIDGGATSTLGNMDIGFGPGQFAPTSQGSALNNMDIGFGPNQFAPTAQGSGIGSSIASGINNLLGTSYTPNQVMPWVLGAGALGAYALMPKPSLPGAPNYPGPMNKNAVGFNAQNFTPNRLFASYAHGGITGLHQSNLGSYSDGGHLLKGPGDGMSDDIPATIAGKQEARLADGEFVVPADVVSHLGNGSTDAGAKHLYKMMDRVRAARTGNPKQGKKIKPEKFLP
jgi:hypothetical protein